MAPKKCRKRDNNDFKELRRFAIGYALSRGMTNEQNREDFAQEYCLAVWLRQKRDIRLQFADFLRKNFGRNDKHACAKQLAKSIALNTIASYEDVFVDKGRRRS